MEMQNKPLRFVQGLQLSYESAKDFFQKHSDRTVIRHRSSQTLSRSIWPATCRSWKVSNKLDVTTSMSVTKIFKHVATISLHSTPNSLPVPKSFTSKRPALNLWFQLSRNTKERRLLACICPAKWSPKGRFEKRPELKSGTKNGDFKHGLFGTRIFAINKKDAEFHPLLLMGW